MRADGHGLPQEMQLHAALLQQKLAVQREIERAAREEDELQRAIEEAKGVNSSEATTGGNITGVGNRDDSDDDDGSMGRSGGDGGDIKGGHGRSRDGQSSLGDEEGQGNGAAGGAPTPRRSSVTIMGGEGGLPGKISLQTKSSGYVSTRRVDRLHVRLRTWPF